jgi:hypothetical protein
MRLQFFRRGGSLLALTLGIAISLFSLHGINESSAGSQFIPALDSFDKSNYSVSNLTITKPAKGDFIGTLDTIMK